MMNLLSIVMISVSVLFLYFIFRNINKNAILLEQAFIWIIIGITFIVFSLFDFIPDWLAKQFGFTLMSNFLLFLAIIVLLVIVFTQMIQISKQKEQLKHLVQELSIEKKKIGELHRRVK